MTAGTDSPDGEDAADGEVEQVRKHRGQQPVLRGCLDDLAQRRAALAPDRPACHVDLADAAQPGRVQHHGVVCQRLPTTRVAQAAHGEPAVVARRILYQINDLVHRSGSDDPYRRGPHDVAEVLGGRLEAQRFMDDAHALKVSQRLRTLNQWASQRPTTAQAAAGTVGTLRA